MTFKLFLISDSRLTSSNYFSHQFKSETENQFKQLCCDKKCFSSLLIDERYILWELHFRVSKICGQEVTINKLLYSKYLRLAENNNAFCNIFMQKAVEVICLSAFCYVFNFEYSAIKNINNAKSFGMCSVKIALGWIADKLSKEPLIFNVNLFFSAFRLEEASIKKIEHCFLTMRNIWVRFYKYSWFAKYLFLW